MFLPLTPVRLKRHAAQVFGNKGAWFAISSGSLTGSSMSAVTGFRAPY